MNVKRCDNCGKETIDAYRFAGDARCAAHEANEPFVSIHVECNEDVLHFDACSWACCAELAFSRATSTASTGDPR